jgi:prepilin peptidase CpaA
MSYLVNYWPLWFISLAMLASAAIDGWKLKVPNWLTFPVVLSGWALGLLHTCGLFTASTGTGDVWASLAGTALGCVLLFPVYAIGGMGAGDVKMQMGFGAWIGAFYGFSLGLWVIVCAFCLAVVIGGVLALAMIVVRGNYRENLANCRAIIGDLVSKPAAAAENAAQRKHRMHLLPYGIPLCLGFLSFLIVHHWG